MNKKKNLRKSTLLLLAILLALTIFTTFGANEVDAATKPPKTSIIYLKSNKEGCMTVKWKKVNSSGYQIQIATNSSFSKGKKTYNVSGKSTVSKTISSLTNGKKYYVKVRAYKKSGSTTKYGSWSTEKNVVIHKHSYATSYVSKNPTCMTVGTRTYKCACGATKIANIDVVAHSLGTDNVCTMCKEECVAYNYGSTKFVGPVNTKKDSVTVNMTRSDGHQYIYKIHFQDSYKFTSHNEYMDKHGCAVSSLTMILNAKVPALAYYKGNDTIKNIEKVVFGSSVYNANYSKTMSKQMPVTLYGMTKIYNKYGVKHKYVYDYSKSTGKTQILNHLKSGKPVQICVKDNGKWANSYHIMTLIGLTDDGTVIIADTSQRDWSGNNQRIKYSSIDEMLDHMLTQKDKPSKVYWGSGGGKYGYILID